MKKNIVTLIAGIVLIFGSITAPAFAEEGTHPCPATMPTMECERFLAGLDTEKPVEDPLIGEDGTFTDEAKAEQIDILVQNAPPAPTQETSIPSKAERPMLPHTGN